jgi:hypothetical protein
MSCSIFRFWSDRMSCSERVRQLGSAVDLRFLAMPSFMELDARISDIEAVATEENGFARSMNGWIEYLGHAAVNLDDI